jgi:hypothetical protein
MNFDNLVSDSYDIKNNTINNFDFDNLGLDPYDIEDNVIEISDNVSDISDTFTNIEEDIPEIDIDSPIKEKSQEQLAIEVEDLFLDLLERKDNTTIFALTGETPLATEIVSEEYFRGFSGIYSRAILYNPALRWYSKLLKFLKEDKFFVDNKSLRLKINSKMFKKIIFPFMGDFKVELRDSSPIVDLIYSLASSINDLEVQKKLNMIKDSQKVNSPEENGLNPSALDFPESLMDIEVIQADIEPEDSDSLGGGSFDFKDNPITSIKFQDLANKSVAQYLIENNISDHNAIVNKLSEERFPKSRIHEILGIVKYINLQDSLPRQIGNKGNGDTNFKYGG